MRNLLNTIAIRGEYLTIGVVLFPQNEDGRALGAKVSGLGSLIRNGPRAASACIFQDDYFGAGRIYERAGDVGLAARLYRDGRCTADALRCFEEIGDEAEIARIYERQHRFDDALAIWQRRGREQDVERVRSEMARRGGHAI